QSERFVRACPISVDAVFEECLTKIRTRRYIRYVASHSALPAECRMRKLRQVTTVAIEEEAMTSISITPGLVAARPATRLRLTTRGRRVMATLAALPVLVA